MLLVPLLILWISVYVHIIHTIFHPDFGSRREIRMPVSTLFKHLFIITIKMLCWLFK